MRVLVTGGAGNVGREVIRLLVARGNSSVVYDHVQADAANAECESGDICDEERLRSVISKHRIDAIAHLASLLQFGCENEPALAVRVNINGTMSVLEAARKTGVRRVVMAGTLATYGGTSENIDETSPIQPDASLYGVTKLLCEKVARRYNALYGLDCRCLRYAAVLSSRQVSSPGVAAALARIFDAIKGKDVLVAGVAAEERRHYAHTNDIALGTALAILSPKSTHDLFNIAGGSDCYTSFQAIADMVKALVPGAGRITFEGHSGDRGRMDISRARTELGFRPEYTLQKAVRDVVESRLATA